MKNNERNVWVSAAVERFWCTLYTNEKPIVLSSRLRRWVIMIFVRETEPIRRARRSTGTSRAVRIFDKNNTSTVSHNCSWYFSFVLSTVFLERKKVQGRSPGRSRRDFSFYFRFIFLYFSLKNARLSAP